MRLLRLLGMVVYTGYLLHVGLLLVLLPWSNAWSLVLLHVPALAAEWLDLPAVRGLLSAFGVLHLMLLGLELVVGLGRSDR